MKRNKGNKRGKIRKKSRHYRRKMCWKGHKEREHVTKDASKEEYRL